MKARLIYSTRMRLKKKKKKPKTHENDPHGNQKPDIFFVWPSGLLLEVRCDTDLSRQDGELMHNLKSVFARHSIRSVTTCVLLAGE